MKAKAETTLIGLLSSALSGYTPSSLPEADYQALYRLAKHHAVANIVAYAMQKNHIKIPPESRALFNRALIAGVYMEANQSAESAAMSQALDDAQIRHIFLKGSVLRKYYPSPDMRTSCDMDVLVDRENIDAACQVMKNRGYRFVEEGEKDILFVKAPNIHVELHKTLAEEEYAGKELFDSILDSSLPDGQRMYARVMTDEDFYVYMIFHVAKHFINGGSGIRSVLDIWIYRKNKPALNESVIREKLRVLKLETFERELVSLSKVWMEGAQGTALSNALSDFVIGAGTFGTQEN
ncbi:MAG TPA: hypothetical protein DCY75_05620, partial [Clostridiales bacterium]|nr:hypothetical protein [Clostridiales bacterium]